MLLSYIRSRITHLRVVIFSLKDVISEKERITACTVLPNKPLKNILHLLSFVLLWLVLWYFKHGLYFLYLHKLFNETKKVRKVTDVKYLETNILFKLFGRLLKHIIYSLFKKNTFFIKQNLILHYLDTSFVFISILLLQI